MADLLVPVRHEGGQPSLEISQLGDFTAAEVRWRGRGGHGCPVGVCHAGAFRLLTIRDLFGQRAVASQGDAADLAQNALCEATQRRYRQQPYQHNTNYDTSRYDSSCHSNSLLYRFTNPLLPQRPAQFTRLCRYVQRCQRRRERHIRLYGFRRFTRPALHDAIQRLVEGICLLLLIHRSPPSSRAGYGWYGTGLRPRCCRSDPSLPRSAGC